MWAGGQQPCPYSQTGGDREGTKASRTIIITSSQMGTQPSRGDFLIFLKVTQPVDGTGGI